MTSSVLVAGVGMIFFIIFGNLSDKIGRKPSIVWGYVLTLLLLFPVFWGVSAYGNPGLTEASRRAPVVVSGPACNFDPFSGEQKSNCGKLIADLAGTGVAYTLSEGQTLQLSVGGKALPVETYAWADKTVRAKQLQQWLGEAGYNLGKIKPTLKEVGRRKKK